MQDIRDAHSNFGLPKSGRSQQGTPKRCYLYHRSGPDQEAGKPGELAGTPAFKGR
jgi:hypothetical protein